MPSSKLRNLPFVLLCLVMGAVCVRLGFWQLDRLDDRRARNALVRARLEYAPVALADLPADTAAVRVRRAAATGTYDYAREFALAGRPRAGSPGVQIVTPLRLAGTDTAVLVKRGWVYSPDATTAELARWRERDTATVRGFVDLYADAGTAGAARAASHARTFRRLDRALLERELGYPLAPVLLVAGGDTAGMGAGRIPVRLEPPPLDEGPHWNYAMQWFAFAGISVAGLAAFLTSERRKAVALATAAG